MAKARDWYKQRFTSVDAAAAAAISTALNISDPAAQNTGNHRRIQAAAEPHRRQRAITRARATTKAKQRSSRGKASAIAHADAAPCGSKRCRIKSTLTANKDQTATPTRLRCDNPSHLAGNYSPSQQPYPHRRIDTYPERRLLQAQHFRTRPSARPELHESAAQRHNRPNARPSFPATTGRQRPCQGTHCWQPSPMIAATTSSVTTP